ncbi:acyl-ACP desaturase [Streptomyces sp. OfavH-34-F]|uniref:acyl-ACP desaturase n=1 Tax=Streptomyces sp. OfavH-34-F TaxID=2917760 RepID=UPI001EF36FDE|nr:acyl-ACP desaturase [Streptomyces sp. OfavH-34-F]MCG7526236.1 acyl-ACP desaturase [Streptomyces sp. OfavH-34-F]
MPQHSTDWFAELEPVVANLLDRHLSMAQEWFPHQYVPWSAGRDYDGPLNGLAWQDAQSALGPVARSALVLSVLTEENLPVYHHQLASGAPPDNAWAAWLHRWTAEEDRHSTVMLSYIHATRAVDPVALERARMRYMSAPPRPDDLPSDPLHGLAYVMIQELATRVAHRNTGLHCGESVCARIFARVAQDENLHMVFYRDLYAALLDLIPDRAMAGLWRAVKEFRMPGQAIPGFTAMNARIALAGWYDLAVFHDDVLMPLVRALRIRERTGLGPQGEQHRAALLTHTERLCRAAVRFRERRTAAPVRAR